MWCNRKPIHNVNEAQKLQNKQMAKAQIICRHSTKSPQLYIIYTTTRVTILMLE